MIWKSGCIYEGEWSNNLKEGKGIEIWPEGQKYEGNFKNSKRDGRMCDYLNDNPIGKHVRLTRNWEVKIENF